MVVAIVAVPALIKGLGADRFGVLTLAWMAIGYLSLLDFGLGRALTKLVAEKLAVEAHDEIPGAFWDSLALLSGVGLLGGLLVWVSSNWIVGSMLKIPAGLRGETLTCFRLIAGAIPAVVMATGLRGFLEAHQRFRPVNIVRTLVGISGFLIPVSILHFSHRVDFTVAILSGIRVITLIAFFCLCLNVNPMLWRQRKFGATPIGPLLRFGGWITFDNLIGPLMVSIDRFIIGTVLSVSLLTYYVVPQEMITKLLIIPMALQQVIFPAFSGMIDRRNRDAGRLYRYSTDVVFLALFPVTLVFVVFAQNVLGLWLGASFAASSYRVLQVLAIGVLANGMAHVPSSMIQAGGHPELNAKLHSIELPIYVLCAWWMIAHYGILGAAAAWTLRVFADSVAFFLIGYRVMPCRPFSFGLTFAGFALIGGAFFLTTYGANFLTRMTFSVLAMCVIAVISWPVLSAVARRAVEP
ncbi:MAG: flippase [Candidatus Acidiferrales bacterium]